MANIARRRESGDHRFPGANSFGANLFCCPRFSELSDSSGNRAWPCDRALDDLNARSDYGHGTGYEYFSSALHATASGSGVPAGLWIRVAVDGKQTYGYLFDPAKLVGERVPVPVDLGNPGDRVFLSLYGTGFRNGTQVQASVGLENVDVSSFGAVAAYQGEDYVNVGPLPRLYHGNVTVQVYFDGVSANAVTVNFP